MTDSSDTVKPSIGRKERNESQNLRLRRPHECSKTDDRTNVGGMRFFFSIAELQKV